MTQVGVFKKKLMNLLSSKTALIADSSSLLASDLTMYRHPPVLKAASAISAARISMTKRVLE
jgi:hypothetical protein